MQVICRKILNTPFLLLVHSFPLISSWIYCIYVPECRLQPKIHRPTKSPNWMTHQCGLLVLSCPFFDEWLKQPCMSLTTIYTPSRKVFQHPRFLPPLPLPYYFIHSRSFHFSPPREKVRLKTGRRPPHVASCCYPCCCRWIVRLKTRLFKPFSDCRK